MRRSKNPAQVISPVPAHERVRTALEKITAEARSWHNFHHGDKNIQCDSICECLALCESVLATPDPLVEVLRETLRSLEHMTTEQFSKGGDKRLREMLQEVLGQQEAAVIQ